jgi:hypothetical protein
MAEGDVFSSSESFRAALPRDRSILDQVFAHPACAIFGAADGSLVESQILSSRIVSVAGSNSNHFSEASIETCGIMERTVLKLAT